MIIYILTRFKNTVELMSWGFLVGFFVLSAVANFAYSESAEETAYEKEELEIEDFLDGRREKISLRTQKLNEAKKLVQERKWPEAAIALRAFLKREPGHFDVSIDLAKSYMYLGRREEALSLLSRLSDRTSKDEKKAVQRRIRVFSRQFVSNETAKIFQEGIHFLVGKKYDKALDRFERALLKEPKNVEIILRKAQCLVIDGRYDSATELLRTANRLNPYEPEINLWLGRALFFKGQNDEAIRNLKQAYQTLKKSESAPIWLAEALFLEREKELPINF